MYLYGYLFQTWCTISFTEWTVVNMTRSGTRDTAEVWQIIAFLDSEYHDEYASIADCLGTNSQLETSYPSLELEKGDALLAINDKDIRNKSKDFVRKIIEELECNTQQSSQEALGKELIWITCIKSNDFKADRHLTSEKVIMILQTKYQLHLYLYFCIYILPISIVLTYVSYPQVAAVTRYWGYCTRCAKPIPLTDYPANRFRQHSCEQQCATQDVSCLDLVGFRPCFIDFAGYTSLL